MACTVYAAFGVCLLLVNLYFSAVTYRSLKTTVALRFENTALVRSLELERDRVAAADRAKTRFLAAAGHDLRQPVHALGMFTDILASRAESGNVTAQDALHVARRQQTVLDSLNRLLDGLLDVSRMDAHLLRIERRAVDLDQLFDDIRLDFESLACARLAAVGRAHLPGPGHRSGLAAPHPRQPAHQCPVVHAQGACCCRPADGTAAY